MPKICYSDTEREVFKGRPIPYDQQPATSYYLNHYSNYLYLSFIANNSDQVLEKLQAESELKICQRKLSHWERHPNWNRSEAEKGVARLKRDWRVKT